MNEFIKILLSLSVSGALLLLLILGLKPLYKNKFSKRWQYYIWIVVALRFLLPFTPDTTIIGSLFEKFDTAAITNEIPTSPNIPVLADTGNSKAEPIQTNREVTTAAMREPVDKYVCLFFIWSALALVLFVRKVTVYQGFIQYIKAGNKEVSDIKILNLLSDCEEKLNIKTRVELSCNPLIASPMLIGFFRPRIILPSHEWEDKELSYIFVHELIHYKQRDMFYKWLIQIVVCVHWFNPFVYLLEKEVNKSCELSCDEKVISILDEKAKREYGDTLISFLKSNNLYKSSLASVTLTEGAEQIKERLGAIMNFKKKNKPVIILTSVLTLFLVISAIVIGVYTTGSGAANAHAAPLSNSQLDTEGKPSLTLDVSSCAVNVLPATDDKISAEYNSNVYDVKIDESDDSRKVSISCKTSTNTNDETIKLYIPDIDYGEVSLTADSAHLTYDFIRSGNIAGNFNMASVFLTLPEGFNGSLSAIANSGYFQLISRDDFKNTTTTITDNGDWGEIYKPKDFTENGNIATFTNGTGANVIQITRKGSGVMGIYTSQHFTISNEFPDDWKDLWSDTWQGTPWEDDWWQNSWKEED
mgnify:FL=1